MKKEKESRRVTQKTQEGIECHIGGEKNTTTHPLIPFFCPHVFSTQSNKENQQQFYIFAWFPFVRNIR